jgi:hypothetical protein
MEKHFSFLYKKKFSTFSFPLFPVFLSQVIQSLSDPQLISQTLAISPKPLAALDKEKTPFTE